MLLLLILTASCLAAPDLAPTSEKKVIKRKIVSQVKIFVKETVPRDF
jgi:hypothetical protein